MQEEKASKLRTAWGGKPCTHKDKTKTYMLGSQMGEFACLTCGEIFLSRGEWEESRASALKEFGGEKP